jgi:hypothetical protein
VTWQVRDEERQPCHVTQRLTSEMAEALVFRVTFYANQQNGGGPWGWRSRGCYADPDRGIAICAPTSSSSRTLVLETVYCSGLVVSLVSDQCLDSSISFFCFVFRRRILQSCFFISKKQLSWESSKTAFMGYSEVDGRRGWRSSGGDGADPILGQAGPRNRSFVHVCVSL